MTIKTKFNIDDRVYIKDLKIWGKVIGILHYARLKYDCRFFNGFDPKEITFLEEELSDKEENKEVGFINGK